MSIDKLQLLMAVHHELCNSAGLREGVRPYTVQRHLEEIEKLIMEEIKGTSTKSTDDIPF